MADKEMTRVQLLREFFYRPGVDTMASFAAEIKLLTEEDRNELAELIANFLGVKIKVQ